MSKPVTQAQVDAARHLKGIAHMRNIPAKLRETRIWIEQYSVIADDETFKRACVMRDRLSAFMDQYGGTP